MHRKYAAAYALVISPLEAPRSSSSSSQCSSVSAREETGLEMCVL